MTDAASDPQYLELFASWLRALGDDTGALAEVLGAGDTHEEVRRFVAAGLNYLFKSLDLIPDGIDDVGFLDDAFVLRVAAAHAVAQTPGARTGIVARLAGEAEAVRAFLDEDFSRLWAYVQRLRKGAARGRTVDDILADPAIRASFVAEVVAWAKSYEMPAFTRDVRTLVKLKAFLSAKLT